MDMRQIKAALAVAEYLSFTMAAVELSFSTSAVSKQVTALENELGVRLFERKASSKVSLTPAAERLLPCLRELGRNYDDLLGTVSELAGEKPYLNFSYFSGLSNLGEDSFITAFYNKHPDITVNLYSEIGGSLIRKMALGKIDACIFVDFQSYFAHLARANRLDSELFAYIPVEKCPLLLAVGEANPLAANDSAALEDFKDETFLFKNYHLDSDMAENHGVRYFIQTCRKHGFTPKIEFTNEEKKSLIFAKAQRDRLVIPLQSTPETAHAGIKIVRAQNVPDFAEKRIYYLKSNRSPALLKFIKCVKELADK